MKNYKLPKQMNLTEGEIWFELGEPSNEQYFSWAYPFRCDLCNEDLEIGKKYHIQIHFKPYDRPYTGYSIHHYHKDCFERLLPLIQLSNSANHLGERWKSLQKEVFVEE